MESTDRRVRSEIGMSQEEALVMLQRHASDNDMLITGFNRLGNRWIASLRPLAEFPPSADDEGDDESDSKPAGEDDGAGEEVVTPKPPVENSEDGPSKEKKDDLPHPDKHPGSENSEEHAIMGLLKQIADALGVQDGPEPKMAPGVGPDVPPPPAPPKPPAPSAAPNAGPKGQPYGTKLKPGEVPNRPGVVPVGAPSFASVKQADSQFSWSPQPATTTPTTSAPPNVTPAGNPGVVSSPPCSKCGGATQGGICPQCAQGAGGAMNGYGMQPQANVDGSFYVRSSVPITPKEAHSELNAAYNPQGYRVAKIYPAHEDGTLTTLIARRP